MGLFDSLFGRGNQIKPSTATTRRFGIPGNETINREAGLGGGADFARQGLRAANTFSDTNIPGFGFGPGFVDRATSPAIVARQRQLREQEIPGISSAASARGLGRSTLATGQIARAQRDASQDISELVARFQILNEQQRKTDAAQAIGFGERLRGANDARNLARANLDTTDLLRADKRQEFNAQQQADAQARLTQLAMTGLGAAGAAAFPAIAPAVAGGTGAAGAAGTGAVTTPIAQAAGPGGLMGALQTIGGFGQRTLQNLFSGAGNQFGQILSPNDSRNLELNETRRKLAEVNARLGIE